LKAFVHALRYMVEKCEVGEPMNDVFFTPANAADAIHDKLDYRFGTHDGATLVPAVDDLAECRADEGFQIVSRCRHCLVTRHESRQPSLDLPGCLESRSSWYSRIWRRRTSHLRGAASVRWRAKRGGISEARLSLWAMRHPSISATLPGRSPAAEAPSCLTQGGAFRLPPPAGRGAPCDWNPGPLAALIRQEPLGPLPGGWFQANEAGPRVYP
jgi:hypothetical protein